MKLTKLTALAVFAGSASPASAAIISFIDEDIAIPTNFIGVSVNLETAAFNNIDEDGLAGADVNFLYGGESITNDADAAGTAPSW